MVTQPQTALSARAEPLNLLAWLLEVWSRFSSRTLSREERDLAELMRFVSRQVGGPLLAAENREDLEARLDYVVLSRTLDVPAYQLFSSKELLTDERLAQLVESPTSLSDGLIQVLGRGAIASIKRGTAYAVASVQAMLHFKAVLGEDWSVIGATAGKLDPLFFLSDPGTPAEVASILLEGRKSLACMYAFSAMMIAKTRKTEPWLRRALADKWADGLYGQLRVFVSMPPKFVPASVISMVPEQDRLDLEKLVLRVAVREQAFKAAFDAAAKSGHDVYAPAEPDA